MSHSERTLLRNLFKKFEDKTRFLLNPRIENLFQKYDYLLFIVVVVQ